jgi:hypothetical protein
MPVFEGSQLFNTEKENWFAYRDETGFDYNTRFSPCFLILLKILFDNKSFIVILKTKNRN